MIHFFRRLFASKLGTLFSLLFLGLILFAFAAGDMTSLNSGANPTGGTVAKVGKANLSVGELRNSVLRAFEAARQQQPGLDQATFVSSGAFDGVVSDLLDSYTLEQYARQQGFGVSKRLIDARIAQNPAFFGVDGKFSQGKFDQLLQQNGINETELRKGLEREVLIEQLLAPIAQPSKVPQSFARPYGDLLLEERSGLATFIPSEFYAPAAAPTTAQLQDYVSKNSARYRVPEQRIVRYALFDAAQAQAASHPTVSDAEIAKFYRDAKDRFTANQIRTFNQVIVPTEAQAKTLATNAASTPMTTAAGALGLSTSQMTAKTAQELVPSTNEAIAKQAFAKAEGEVVGPTKIALGWSVIKIEKVENNAAKTLAQARPVIEEELLARKKQEAVGDFFNKLQDLSDGGASVEEIARENGLKIATTPLMFANGQAAGNPDFKPDAVVGAIAPVVFQADKSGEAQLFTIKEGEQFAVIDAARIAPSAVPSLSVIQPRVIEDWKRTEGSRKARDLARKISDLVSKGTPLEAAIKAEGARTQPIQRIGGKRSDLATTQGGVPPEIALLFSMAPKTAKTMELPNSVGWMVLFLDQSKRGTVGDNSPIVPAIQEQMGQSLGREYVDLMIANARKAVGVKRNVDAIAALKAELSGARQTTTP